MDNRAEISDFLRSRRAKITPAQAGIIGGGRRRVAGLRREEVAILAGMSSDYYAKIERGSLSGVSPEVLNSLARALNLDDAETGHLINLAASADPSPIRRQPRHAPTIVRPSLQYFLDSITGSPTWVRNVQMDAIATNPLGRELMRPVFDDPDGRGNNARFTFLSPAARTFYPDWEQSADGVVASLRTYAGQDPRNRGLTDLIGELVTRSDAFRDRWAAHNVRFHRSGLKRIHHPDVGDLEFFYEGMDLPDSPGWSMFAFTCQPGSPTEERVALLGSLAATAGKTNHDPLLRKSDQTR